MLSARRLAASSPSPSSAKGGGPHLRAVSAAPQFEDDIASTDHQTVEADLMAATVPTANRVGRPQAARKVEPEGPATEMVPAAQAPESPKKVRARGGRKLPEISASKSNPRLAKADTARGLPRLFFELYWGEVRHGAHGFGPILPKKPVMAAHRGDANLPLWGFSLPTEPMLMAEQAGSSYRVFVPPGAAIEKRQTDDNFYPVAPEQLESRGGRRCLTLSNGMAARFSEGEMLLVVYVQPALQQPRISPLHGLPWLMLTLLTLFMGGFFWFLLFGPKPGETADFMQKDLPPVAVRLIAPEPKKKEEAQKKLEAIKEKAEKAKKKVETPVAKEAPKPKKKEREEPPPPTAAPPPETRALKALAKLTAAGPASGDILAAVDKLGNGPGSKNSNFKLSGLIGKAPIANAGLGTFGLGGGGGGGFGTRGAEILRGRGGGGIGALGAGSVGRGSVGGTVTRASARSLGVQGSIDREAVAKCVNSHLQEVRACYERALLREPGLAGKVVLEWNISTAGKVVSAKTKTSTLRNSAVEACILQNLKGWIFPPARGGIVIVSYPFLFNSVGY